MRGFVVNADPIRKTTQGDTTDKTKEEFGRDEGAARSDDVALRAPLILSVSYIKVLHYCNIHLSMKQHININIMGRQ